MLRVLLLAAALASSGSALAQEQPTATTAGAERDLLSGAVDGFIRPGYDELAARTSDLRSAVSALCENPSDGEMAAAREAFGESVEAWSRVEMIRFGPIVENNAAERIFFFPDRRGIGLRQVQAALAEEDASATEVDSLRAKSVALQGLGTLEFLLYGTGSDALAGEAEPYRCRFAVAVAGAVAATADEVDRAWNEPNGIAAHFAEPQAGQDDFRTLDDSERALLGVFTNGLELISDTRIAPFLGDSAEEANPKLAPWWRSGSTADALAANLQGLRDLYERSGMADIDALEGESLGGEIGFEFANAERALSEADRPLPDSATDTATRGPLTYLLIVTRSLRDLFASRYSAAIGLTAGFSSLDGD